MTEPKANPTSGQKVPKFHRKSQQERAAEAKLRMERRGEKLDKAKEKLANQKAPKKPGAVKKTAGAAGWSVHGFVHGKISEVEHENVGTEGAHRSELVGESVYRYGNRTVKKAIREHPAKAVRRAESKHIKDTADYHFRQTIAEYPEMQTGNALSRYFQKQRVKRQYAKQAREAVKQTAMAAEKTAVTTEKLVAHAAGVVKRHPVGALLFVCCFLLIVLLQSCMSSLVTVGNGVIGAIGASTYVAEDRDMLAAEAAYCALEDELREYLDSYESTHDYDEYHFDLDEIKHDPYVLISILSALHEGAWTVDEVQGTLQMLFDRQYILTEEVEVERRYYLETDTWTDEDGNTHTDTYRVYYNYYICTVSLENFNLSHLPIYIMGKISFPGMPCIWRRWATVQTCSHRPPPMWQSIPPIPWSMRSRRRILPTKPLPRFWRRPKSISVIPMYGADTSPAHPLIAPASCPMSTINAAGTLGVWGRRACITSAAVPAHPGPAIWCSSPGLMIPPAFPM